MFSFGFKKIGKTNQRRLPILLATWIIVFQIQSFASTPADYKKRIDFARAGISELSLSRVLLDTTVERDTIEEIERLVPEKENIKWPGGEIETDNGWFRSRLAEYSASKDAATRNTILILINERLLAISAAAEELVMAQTVDPTKDQDKRKLSEILSRPEYQKQEPPKPSLFQKWTDAIVEWLAKFFPKPSISSEPSVDTGSLRLVLQILIFTIVLAVVGFLIYRYAPFLLGRVGSKKASEKQDRVILGERIAADESASGLFSEAERLARDGNLRAAIRKGYVALLCDLSDRKLVRLARHKTNRDYLRDVRKDQGLFENMTGLTRSFEINWYGLRDAEQADWDDFRMRYLQTIAEVKR
ncbi:hypothetical protein BH10ACI2_BH10ACI2_21140 [soil metagenome]